MIIRLKQELEAAKNELIKMEEQRKDENEELIHLYVDIEVRNFRGK